jgi:hypothetical protein
VRKEFRITLLAENQVATHHAIGKVFRLLVDMVLIRTGIILIHIQQLMSCTLLGSIPVLWAFSTSG